MWKWLKLSLYILLNIVIMEHKHLFICSKTIFNGSFMFQQNCTRIITLDLLSNGKQYKVSNRAFRGKFTVLKSFNAIYFFRFVSLHIIRLRYYFETLFLSSEYAFSTVPFVRTIHPEKITFSRDPTTLLRYR